MKICFVVSTYPRSDEDLAVPWLREDLRRLKARGYDIQVFAPAFKGSPDHLIDGIRVRRFRYFLTRKEDLTHDAGAPTKIRRPAYLMITVFYLVFGTLSLVRFHRRERFDIIHVHWPFPHGLFGVVASWFARTKLVMSFYGAELLLARTFPFVNPSLRFFLRRAAAVTCISSYTAAHINMLGVKPAVVLPYGSPIPERTLPRPANRVKKILFVGRLIERKGVEYLLQALPLVREKVDASLVIVGNGPLLGPLKAQVAAAGLDAWAEFRVDVPEQELMAAYSECDVFVLPAIVDSRGDTEGLGVVLIEALSFRRPVVASAVGGIVDVIQHEKTGLLVPEKDPHALADALVRLLSDPAYAVQLAEQGYANVKAVFDWDRILDETERLYSAVLSGNQPDPNPPAAAARRSTTG